VTDAQAITASLADPEVFAVLFDRHFDAVHGYAQRRVGPDLADEVAAETFTRAFDRRRRYDATREDARPWLLGIAANLLRRHWRTERRRLAAYARSAERPGGERAAVSGQDIVAALERLPRREREPLLLLAWADLSYEQISVALGLPVGTVRSRISRGRKRLQSPAHEPETSKEAANSV
jgi:RNA polymerase sigma-70 factor (ECF subfamily)